MRHKLLNVFCLFLLLGCQKALGSKGSDEKTIVVAGIERTYTLHLPPSYDGKTKIPLVIAMHGGGGNGGSMDKLYGLNEAADKEGVAVVYPNGSGRLKDKLLTWNSGNCCGYALDNKIDDVAFIKALISELKTSINADPKRIYATGMSNGGMMSYRVACELSDEIAGIAPVAGALNVEPCKPTQPVSLLIFHGRDDQHVLYEGGPPKEKADSHERVDQSVAFAASFFRTLNECKDEAKKEEKGNVLFELNSQCKAGSAVGVYSIKGQGHAWPGGKKGTPRADEPSTELNASALMIRFFLEHPRE
jgi:polyhydroxybutyrate depolymerase